VTPAFHLVGSPYASIGLRAFTLDGAPRLTVIVKLALDLLQPNARVTSPPPIEFVDRFPEGRMVASPIASSDVALRKKACDVTLIGSARTVGGQPAPTLPVKLAIYRGNTPILRKAVVANGKAGARGPEPITSAPLTFERALGGSNVRENPLGTATPTVVLARDATQPGCLAPIPAVWPIRRDRLDARVHAQLNEAVPEIPSSVDWGAFHVAPTDQQTPFLMGGDWLVIEGVSAVLARIQTRMPSLDAHALLVSRGGGAPVPVNLAWDALAIDADAVSATATLRGDASCPVPFERAADLAVVIRFGASNELPSTAELFDDKNLTPVLARGQKIALGETTGLSAADHLRASSLKVAPFAIAQAGEQPAAHAAAHASATPWGAQSSQKVAPATSAPRTVALSLDNAPSSVVPPSGSHFAAPPVAPPLVAPAPVAPPLVAPAPVAPSPVVPAPIASAPAYVAPVAKPEGRHFAQPSYLLGQPPIEQSSAPHPPPMAPPASQPEPPRMGAPISSKPQAATAAKRASPRELAEAALRKSGMSEQQIARVLREMGHG
jgi:hypothetical protein